MSKKSRKRNKKILGALAAGLGAMALMKRRKTNALNAITAGDIVDTGTLSGKAGEDTYGDISSASVVVPKKVVAAPVKKVTSAYPRSSRGIGDYGVVTAPKRVNNVLIKGRNNAEMGRNVPFHPSQGNLYKPSFTMQGDTRGWKSGGRVKGAGCAKRGFGRALKKK
jgi:hypothetical protein